MSSSSVPTLVIIGAGPAGLLLAHSLLQRGTYRVLLFDRRPDPRSTSETSNRTFPISLQERGRKALRAIPGLEDAIAAQSTPCRGTVIYRKRGNPRRISRKNAILSIERHRLVGILLQQLTATYGPEHLTVQFGCRAIEINPAAQTITLQPETGDRFTVTYDVLVGADGARSRVRQALVESGQIQAEETAVPDAYKSVYLRRCAPEFGLDLDADKIHSWNLDNKTRLILVPQAGDRLNGTLIFNADANPLEAFRTPEEILTYFQTHFPAVGQLMTHEEAEALLHRPIARILTVRCDAFHGDRILLLGDAAHAVSPSIGQGCNASLQDIGILMQLLDRYHDDWSQVLPAFTQTRLPDAHALRDLSDYSFPRKPHLVLEFFLRLSLSRLLHPWFPRWVSPFLFDLVLDSDLTHTEILSLNQRWISKVKRSMQA